MSRPLRRAFLFLSQNGYMRSLIILIYLLCAFKTNAQETPFPAGWTGHWKGELQWFRPGQPEPRLVNMELKIRSLDSAGVYTWQIIYGKPESDNRPYLLLPKDPAAGHFQIDERNGIVLDQFRTGNRISGAFTVGSTTIVNSYRLEAADLIVEFYSLGAQPLSSTGAGTEESPKVDSYRLSGYQKAVLKKTN